MEIPINVMIEVPTTTSLSITKGIVNNLHLDFDGTFATMRISYLDSTNKVVSTRNFYIGGKVYSDLINITISGNLAEIVLGKTATFAMQLIANPEMIDGVDVIEI